MSAGDGNFPFKSAWFLRGRGRGLTPSVGKQVIPAGSEQVGYVAFNNYFFEASAPTILEIIGTASGTSTTAANANAIHLLSGTSSGASLTAAEVINAATTIVEISGTAAGTSVCAASVEDGSASGVYTIPFTRISSAFVTDYQEPEKPKKAKRKLAKLYEFKQPEKVIVEIIGTAQGKSQCVAEIVAIQMRPRYENNVVHIRGLARSQPLQLRRSA